MKPFLPAPSFLFLVIAEERGLCAGFVCKAANLRARRQQSTARPRPRPVGFATWKFDVGISRGYFIYLFIYLFILSGEILHSGDKKSKSQCDSYSGFLGKILAQSRQIWTKRIWKRHIYRKRFQHLARPKILKLPDSDKSFQHAAKISEIARFRQKLLPHCQIWTIGSSMSPKYSMIPKFCHFPLWPIAKFG